MLSTYHPFRETHATPFHVKNAHYEIIHQPLGFSVRSWWIDCALTTDGEHGPDSRGTMLEEAEPHAPC